eukprot:7260596-Lingulodinium_polyedra.AAC.1
MANRAWRGHCDLHWLARNRATNSATHLATSGANAGASGSAATRPILPPTALGRLRRSSTA